MKNKIQFATSDIETNNWIDFLMIGFFDGKNYRVFDNLDDYFNYLKKYDDLRVYFHNGGKFDFLFLIEKLLNEYEVIDIIEQNTKPILIKCRIGKSNISFVDSLALLPASLDSLIKTYDISEYKKIEIDFTKKRKFNDKKLQQHLLNDCKALYFILKKVYEKFNRLDLTIGSLSLNIFMNEFLEGELWENGNEFDNYFRTNYYRGGRCEVIKVYGKNLYYYDVNSLYPFVMLEKMPIGSPLRTKEFKENKIGFYKIKLKQNTNFKISPLVIKTATGNYYVNGKKGNVYYMVSPELEILIKHKIKFEVLDGYYFYKADYLFNDFVNHFYKIKSETKDETERYLSKLMLNSLYGKLGQQLTGEKIKVKNKKDKYFKVFDSYNDLIIVDVKRNVKFKGVYLASYITSLARAYHFSLMEKIGFENIYYCDTDSIITDKKIKTGTGIGELKLEHKIKEGVFIAPKTYGFIDDKGKEHTHYKGFSQNTFTYDELKKIANNEVNFLIVEGEKMLGFRSSQSRKNGIIKENGKYLKLVREKKTLTKQLNRREYFSNKKCLYDSKPFLI